MYSYILYIFMYVCMYVCSMVSCEHLESSEEYVRDAYYIHMAQWHRAALSLGRGDVADYVRHDVTELFKAMNRTGATYTAEGKGDFSTLPDSAWRYCKYRCMYIDVCMYLL